MRAINASIDALNEACPDCGQALAARVAALESAVADLQRGLWPEPARALRRALAVSTQGLPFTAKELIAHAREDRALALAIKAAYLEFSPACLGAWLRDHRGAGDGIAITRVRRRWVVTLATSSASGADSVA
jgi:hypothetical protein